MKGISEKTLIKIKDLKASVKLNNGDMLTTVTNANMESPAQAKQALYPLLAC